MMTGYRRTYLVSTASMGVAAIMNTLTFLLLRYFIDNYFDAAQPSSPLWIIVAGFVALAVGQAFFTFTSRRLAAKTAEGIAQRLRNYLYDHIQRLPFVYHDKSQTGELLQRATSDVDTIRRFFADQAIEAGRIVMLFVVNFAALLYLDWTLAWFSIIVVPDGDDHLALLLPARGEGVRAVPGAGGEALEHAAGEPDRRARRQGLRPPGIRRAEVRQGEPGQVSQGALPAAHARALLADHGHPVWPADAGGLRLRRVADHQRRHHRRHLPGLRRPGGLDHLAAAQPGPAHRADVGEPGLLRPRVAGRPGGPGAGGGGQRAAQRRRARRGHVRQCRVQLRRHRALGAAWHLASRCSRASPWRSWAPPAPASRRS